MNSKGQFSIVAALLVAVILIATVIITYSTIRNSPIQDQPQILSAIDETNLALKQILGFTVGYYGSVLQVTGNSSYARVLATNYLGSGLENIGDVRPEWGSSFNVTALELGTNWFTNASYSRGTIAIKYDLTGLGVYGVTYSTSCRLDVQVLNSNSSSQACLSVFKDENEPLISLGKQNFKFYRYLYSNNTWELVNPTSEPIAFSNGTYSIDLPAGIEMNSYVLQVEDPRGIVTVASSFNRYTCTLNWSSGNYSTIPNDTLVVELLQNGTMRWLGQNLQLTTETKPIPPIPVKSIRVNQTINGINQEVPFQIEDWASEYRIPLGLTNNASIFNSRTMLVFLMNSQASKATIWWDGNDNVNQTACAYTNLYFKNDDQANGKLTNGMLTLQFSGSFVVTSTVGSTTSTANFMRINSITPTYGSNLAYIIHHGIVRDIIHQEAEWSDGITNCPNVYSQIVITLPANVTYYTYQLRLMFLNSTRSRTITELCPISLSSSINKMQTENGTLSGLPVTVNTTSSYNSFYNFSDGRWAHHWSQFISGTTGAGIMFTDTANRQLYVFDAIANKTTGALNVTSTSTSGKIELLPVTRYQVQFTYALDVTWHGAVVTFDSTKTPIYKMQGSTPTGLWILVEYPPTVAVTTEM